MAARRRGGDAEYVGGAGAVGADRAPVLRVALAVVGRRADLVLGPCVATIVGDGYLQRRRRGVALLLTDERRPAHIDSPEERARGRIVGPDLRFVGERGG